MKQKVDEKTKGQYFSDQFGYIRKPMRHLSNISDVQKRRSFKVFKEKTSAGKTFAQTVVVSKIFQEYSGPNVGEMMCFDGGTSNESRSDGFREPFFLDQVITGAVLITTQSLQTW